MLIFDEFFEEFSHIGHLLQLPCIETINSIYEKNWQLFRLPKRRVIMRSDLNWPPYPYFRSNLVCCTLMTDRFINEKQLIRCPACRFLNPRCTEPGGVIIERVIASR